MKTSIGYLDLEFPKLIVVDDLLFSKQENDTILYAGEIGINIAILPLLSKKIVIRKFSLNNTSGDLHRLIENISSSDSTQESENKQKSQWDLVVHKIRISNTHLSLNDAETGFDLDMNIGSLGVRIGKISKELSDISVKELKLENTKIKILLYQGSDTLIKDKSDSDFETILATKLLILKNVTFDLKNDDGMEIGVQTGYFQALKSHVDVYNSTVSSKNILIKDTHCQFSDIESFNNDSLQSESSDMDGRETMWNISGELLKMEDSGFSYDIKNSADHEHGFNPDHVNFIDGNAVIKNYNINGYEQSVEIDQFSLNESHGFSIKSLHASIDSKEGISKVDDFTLRTENSDISIDLFAAFNPFYIDLKADDQLQLELISNFNNLKDIYYFYPALDSMESIKKTVIDSPLSLSFKIEGIENDLDIEYLDISILDSTKITFSGNLKNSISRDDLIVDIRDINVQTSKTDIVTLLPTTDSLNPLFFPDYLLISGDFIGSKASQNFSGSIKSNVGEIEIKDISVIQNDQSNYSADLLFDLHDLNKLNELEIESFNGTLKANYKGKGTFASTAFLDLKVDSLKYQNYNFQDFSINGEIEKGEFDVNINSNDENFNFSLLSNGNIQENEKHLSSEIIIKNVDLNVLKAIKKPLKFNGRSIIELSVIDTNYYSLEADISSLNLFHNDSIYPIHPIDITFETDDKQTLLDLNSDLLKIHFYTGSDIEKTLNIYSTLADQYFNCDQYNEKSLALSDFNLALKIEDPESIEKVFFSDLPSFSSLELKSTYANNDDLLSIELEITDLSDRSFFADTLLFNVSGNSEDLDFNLLSSIDLNQSLKGSASLYGKIKCTDLTANLSYKDLASEEVIFISTLIKKEKDDYLISIKSDSLILAYDSWNINPANKITINDANIDFEEFQLLRANQEIAIQNKQSNDGFTLAIKQYELGRFQQLLEHDTIIEGIVDAQIDFSTIQTDLSIEGKLSIDDLKFQGIEIGKADLRSFSFTKDKIDADIEVTGDNIELTLDGSYLLDKDKNNLSAKLIFEKLAIDQLNYLLEDKIYDAQGELKGEIDIEGTINAPVLNGNVIFEDAAIGIIYLNEVFEIGNERIDLVGDVVKFNDFTMTNQLKESFKINGNIYLGKEKKYYSDLIISIDPIELMNTKKHNKGKNEMIYGLLKTEGNIHISGTPEKLSTNAIVTIDKTTDLTYTFPENLIVADNDGIVRFVSAVEDTAKEFNVPEHPFFSLASFKTIDTKVIVEKGTKFNLFFQELSNNMLEASISGSVNYHLKDDVSQTSGRITIDEGNLVYSLPLITAKKYKIEPGSYFSIADELYNPEIHFKASTTIRASTETLIADYKKVMSFKVYLIMEGELDDIHLSFDIDTDTGDPIVSGKLNQLTEKERNINALNLLIRGAFIISVGGPSEGSATMLNSQIDKFYAEFLNALVSENIAFVDLNFDVQSYRDYSETGDKSNVRKYYYTVGKSFLHDRARVTYTGSVDVLDNKENVNATFEQSHLEAEIKLDKKGTFNALLFRKNNYEGLLEGEIIATGGGFRIKKNYYSFKDIFILHKNREKKNKEEEKTKME